MDSSIFIFFAAILIVAGLTLAVIVLTKGGGKQLNQEKFRTKWLTIENSLKKDESASHSLAVMNADKLLDEALREAGVAGQTMGERLKASGDRYKNRNAVWAAHKLRNQIAHETDVVVNYDAARRALASFKQAMKDVGAI